MIMTEKSQSKPPLTVEEAINRTNEVPTADVKAWQDEQVLKAIAEADGGDFVTAEELKATVRKLLRHG